MTKKRIKRKAASKTTRKTTARRKKKDVSLADVEYATEKMAILDFADETKQELKKLGEHIHEATDKGVHVAKDIAEEVRKFAQDATNLTRIKIELHNLKIERKKMYSLLGKHLSNLYKANKLSGIKTKFKDDFAKLNELDAAIEEREKQAAGLSLS